MSSQEYLNRYSVKNVLQPFPFMKSRLVKNYPTDDFKRVLDAAEEGEVKQLLQVRLDNYNRKNKM